MRKTATFLTPTVLVLLGFAAWEGVGRFWASSASPEPPDFVASSDIRPDNLPDLGADRLVLPDPAISPTKVVETQLAGLADPDSGGVGILQCYCFASPGNRAATGPLERFGLMVRQGEFACLARPQATLVGKPQISGRLARLLVTVVDENRQLRAFTFILSRQMAEPFENCWMTEAVYPVGSPAPPPAPPSSDSESAATI